MLSLSLDLSHTHTNPCSLSLSLSLTHTHTQLKGKGKQTPQLIFFVSTSPILINVLSLSLDLSQLEGEQTTQLTLFLSTSSIIFHPNSFSLSTPPNIIETKQTPLTSFYIPPPLTTKENKDRERENTKREMHLQHLNTTTNTTSLFLSFFLDDLLSFCTFLASHPLPLAYLLFFSPHILSLLSFLSPLLLSTALLLLTFTTPPPHALDDGDPTLHPPKFLGKTCAVALQLLKRIEAARDDGTKDPIGLVEHLDWIVLSPCRDAPTPCLDDASRSSSKLEEKGATVHSLEESKGAKLSSCNEHISENSLRSCSIRRRALHARAASEGVQREGSMRREREWKRTLACKLYEERITFKLHDERAVDVEGGEEMDLLWEAYEVNAGKINNGCKKEKKRVKDERKKEPKVKAEAKAEAEAETEEEDEEEEEEEGSVRQLCCLKALKLSTGNMNLGVGRPNLMKISKVLKGMRMFQHFGKHSNSRKK